MKGKIRARSVCDRRPEWYDGGAALCTQLRLFQVYKLPLLVRHTIVPQSAMNGQLLLFFLYYIHNQIGSININSML